VAAGLPRIALTSGEPAGIGPDLCLQIAAQPLPCELICLADHDLLAARARQLGINIVLRPYNTDATGSHRGETAGPHEPGTLSVLHVPLSHPCTAGQLDPHNAHYVLALLDRAIDGCCNGEFAALATAPVHKGIINTAGVSFRGHTEYLAVRTHSPRSVMLLATDTLRVALATTHLPLREVSAAISTESLCEILTIIVADLRRWFGISTPRVAVCGLNPHAGEGGYLGDEEIRVITPAIERLRATGSDVSGPLPADTAFVPQNWAKFDVVLAMYHDQGLPVIKYAGFESAVNITLGLPILRTSVDHGTALDLAGTGRADAGSLMAAIELAAALTARRAHAPAT
jgi:4-hydroxythreonine-4-phosphate dehydrogenase